MVCEIFTVPKQRAFIKKTEVQSGQLILFLGFESIGEIEVPISVDIFDNGEVDRNISKTFNIDGATEGRTAVIFDLPERGADVKVCIHPDQNPECETRFVEGNKDFGGGDDPDNGGGGGDDPDDGGGGGGDDPDNGGGGGGDDPDNGGGGGDDPDDGGGGSGPPRDTPSIGPPEITNTQTIQNLAHIAYSLTNTGTVTGEKTVRGTLDLGGTGEVDEEKTDTIKVDPQDTSYEAFEFETDLSRNTEAVICVKEA